MRAVIFRPRQRHPGGRRRAPAQPAIEVVALVVSTGLLLAVGTRFAGRLDGAAGIALAVLAAVSGYVAADLVSGLVHWFCDRFFEDDSALIGPLLIAPFREHHRDPRGMTRHGFLELTGNSALGLVPVLGAASWAPLPPFADAALIAFALAALATNLLHGWAHAERVPAAIAWLQTRRLILGPEAHAQHHAPGHRGAYCVTSGWMNGLADSLGVFERLERTLRALGVPATRAS
jgi:sterol desaturase/sphingolipid hydroxylase (fatty acid hydroxylase superfamily)